MANFLEQHFSSYLDTTLPPMYVGPNHSDSQSPPFSTLQTAFRESGVDSELLDVLQEALAQQNPQERLSQSLSLGYVRAVYQALEALITKESLNQEALIKLLIQYNFNVPAFISWYNAQLQEEIGSIQNSGTRLQRLYYYQKVYQQLPVQTDISYYANQPTAQEQLLRWLEAEIAYAKQVGEVPISTTIASPRIKTNLSVAELSLLIRVLFDVEVLPDQTKANVYRHVSQVFDSVEQEGISVNTLRDQQYRPSRHTIASLKDKVIAMMNLLNRL